MLSEIDGMLQSLYMLNNAPVKTEMDGSPDAGHAESPAAIDVIDALPFEVTVKSHKECTAREWENKQTRGEGKVLSPTVEMTPGGVVQYSYSIPVGKPIQTYFSKKTSTTSPVVLRVYYWHIEKGEEPESDQEVQSDGCDIQINDEEAETIFPVTLGSVDEVDGWNIYKDSRLKLRIRFHA